MLGVGFHGENYPWGGIFLEVNVPGKISYWGDLTEFLYETLFICLTFSLKTKYCVWRCSMEITLDNFN